MSAIQQLLTDHIGIWTAAETGKRSGRGRASGSAASVYGIKKLRELILELAVRGKLVPQDTRDEPVSELLKRVANDKSKKIAGKRQSKDILSTSIMDNEVPFELPKNWEWVRLGEIIRISSGDGLTASQMAQFGTIAVYGGNGITGYHDAANINKRTLVIGRVGFYCGSIHITPETAWVTDNAFITEFSEDNILLEFLYWLLRISNLKENESATAQPVISGKKVYPVVVALPSLTEQHRIVAKVDELMALCDQLEALHSDAADAHEQLVSHLLGTLTQSQSAADFNANWQRIAAHFDALFTTESSIDVLKQTLLQLAVMGKLVTQDANDEPASELIERIEAEKLKLIAEGKIKKNIPPAAIADEHQPFSLPLGWTWLRLDDLMPQFQNGASSRGDADGEAVVVLRLADIKDRRIVLDDPRELLISPTLIDKYRLSKNDILIVRVNGSADLVGGFIVCEGDFHGIYCDHFIRMKVSQDIINSRFLGLIGSSALIRKKINDLFITTAGQKTVNQGHISSLLIPVPSIAEQHRIVAKIDELMGMCSDLRNCIADANQQQKKLADVLVEHAVVG